MIEYFLKNSVVTICLNATILLLGWTALPHLANEFIPAIEIPAVALISPTTVLPPDDVKTNWLGPLERKLMARGFVESIETRIETDKSISIVFCKWRLTPVECLSWIRATLAEMQRPPEILDPLLVLHRPTLAPILRVAVFGAPIEVMTKPLNVLKKEIERIPGVAALNLNGLGEDRFEMSVSTDELLARGLTLKSVVDQARQVWAMRWTQVSPTPNSLNLSVSSGMDTPATLMRALLPPGPHDTTAIMSPVIQVRKAATPTQVIVQNDQPGVIIELIKSPGADAISTTNAVLSSLGEITAQRKLGMIVIYNEAAKIIEAQQGVLQNFTVGIILNSIILLIFLGSSVGALVASCIFPTAIFGTLYIMKLQDISLNIFALNGFSLASGMITDASIVVLESIVRRKDQGQDLFVASSYGAMDVFWGVVASALTTAAVILPISLQTGVSSKLFADLGAVLVATQLISLIAVFTFVPWLCVQVLSPTGGAAPSRRSVLSRLNALSDGLVGYTQALSVRILRWAAERRVWALSIPLVGIFLSLTTIVFMPASEFLPLVGARTYSLLVPLPQDQLDPNDYSGVEKLAHLIYNPTAMNWLITQKTSEGLKSTFEVSRSGQAMSLVSMPHIANQFAIDPHSISLIPQGPVPNNEPYGLDGYYFLSHSLSIEERQKIRQAFCESTLVVFCRSSRDELQTLVELKPRSISLAQMQSGQEDLGIAMVSHLRDLDITAAANLAWLPSMILKFNATDLRHHPIPSAYEPAAFTTIGQLFDESISTVNAVSFRFQGADYEPLYFKKSPTVTIGQVTEHMNLLANGSILDRPKESLDLTSVIRGMGGLATMNETFTKMTQAMIIAGLLVMLILVIQFGSLIQAALIMTAIPLAVGGAIGGLILFDESFNAGVIVGFVLLIGIVVNNGILLTEAINQRQEQGLRLMNAIEESIATRTRPILMTTFSTIFGMLPTLVLPAEGSELYRGMAIVNIFGMLVGTFLTLVVVPIMIQTYCKDRITSSH